MTTPAYSISPDCQEVFADHVRIGFSPLTYELAFADHAMRLEGESTKRVHTIIRMSPHMAKLTLLTLASTLKAYEAAHGTILLPKELAKKQQTEKEEP